MIVDVGEVRRGDDDGVAEAAREERAVVVEDLRLVAAYGQGGLRGLAACGSAIAATIAPPSVSGIACRFSICSRPMLPQPIMP